MTAIVDYGVGNLFSLKSSLRFVGADVTVTGEAEEIRRADRIILPGVGAFGDAAKKLRERVRKCLERTHAEGLLFHCHHSDAGLSLTVDPQAEALHRLAPAENVVDGLAEGSGAFAVESYS